MGRGESEVWDENPDDVKQTQPKKHPPTESKSSEKSGSSCPKCCLKTRDCLMSPECGRALQISSVVAMCGMCLRMFVCKSKLQKLQAAMIQHITGWVRWCLNEKIISCLDEYNHCKHKYITLTFRGWIHFICLFLHIAIEIQAKWKKIHRKQKYYLWKIVFFFLIFHYYFLSFFFYFEIAEMNLGRHDQLFWNILLLLNILQHFAWKSCHYSKKIKWSNVWESM